MPTPLRAAVLAATTALALTALSTGGGASADAPVPAFERVNVDTAVSGAAFTVVGEIFPGEQNIVTVGYGSLSGGAPSGGGTLQVYRPGRDLTEWTKVRVFDASAEIVFPNRPTIADVDGDGLNDIIQPSGYFFDTNPANPGGAKSRSAITWWRNLGLEANGTPRGFTRADVVTGQPGSYHGVEYVDLDGDGIKDLVTTSEAGKVADDQTDDTVRLQYLKGRAAGAFDAPVTLAEGSGGSLPVAYDVNADGRLDIVSSQYFGLSYFDQTPASFMWFEQTGTVTGGVLDATNFTRHVIATAQDAGFGFQIRPVPGFRGPGTVSWIATNHQGRCFVQRLVQPMFPSVHVAREMVMELVPGNDLTDPWEIVELSTPDPAPANPDACDPAFNVSNSPVSIHPGDNITARSSGGQAAPGVFGYGDFDSDGDIDLLVSGDGDRRLFWIEQRSDSSTRLHTLTAPGEVFGQSGGAAVADLDGDGVDDVVFSSFDTNTVALWSSRVVRAPELPTTPVTPTTPVVPTQPAPSVTAPPAAPITSRLKVTGPKRVAKGAKAKWKLRLTASPAAGKRTVRVSFRPNRGKAQKVATLTLSGKGSVSKATLNWRPRKAGKLVFTYAGRPGLDTAASATSKVRLRSR